VALAGVVARGSVVRRSGQTMWLRMTDAGFDFIGHLSWPINDTTWECDLSKLVEAAGRSASTSRHYNVHVSVWDSNVEQVRVSSGFFSVGT
jgi:hypothetical protein